jgi:DNA-binding transcriptional LysR family regulator
MIIPRLNPSDLIVFHFVVNERSIKLASDKLCLTQPTVSYHIGTLERSVGTRLIEAKRGTLRLTQTGKDLAQYASKIYHDMASAEQFVESLRQPVLRAGIAFTFSVALRSVVPQFEQQNLKEVRLVMINGSSFDIVEDVLNSRLDVGIVVSFDYGKSDLRFLPLSTREKMVIVASPFDPVFEKDKVELADLSGRKFILASNTSATHQILLKRFETEGLSVQAPQFETVNNIEWSKYLVESGEALDFLHIKSVEQQISQGRLAIVPVPADFRVGADAVVRKDTFITKAIDTFISSVRRTFKIQH